MLLIRSESRGPPPAHRLQSEVLRMVCKWRIKGKEGIPLYRRRVAKEIKVLHVLEGVGDAWNGGRTVDTGVEESAAPRTLIEICVKYRTQMCG